jgi:starch-binding outer membrane protein, SusD/RagB family
MFEAGLARFTTALGIDNASELAAVGRGRALLNLGRFDEAATAVASVPTQFVYKIEHSANTLRQNNSVFALQDNGRYSVAEQEGGGLPFRSAMDPRVPWIGPFAGFDPAIPEFINLRYSSFDADVPLASGVEARLIEAEAALRRGDVATWLTRLNALRADVFELMAILFDDYDRNLEEAIADNGGGFGPLAPLADPGTDAARVDLMFRERAFWLYNTGHRLGDLRRLARAVSAGGYGRPVATVFPHGSYFKGGEYGADVAFSVPQEEVNNPNFNANSCNTTLP